MNNKKVTLLRLIVVVYYVHRGIAYLPEADCKQDETEIGYDKSSTGKHFDKAMERTSIGAEERYKSNDDHSEVMEATVTVNGIKIFDKARLDLLDFNFAKLKFFCSNDVPEDLKK